MSDEKSGSSREEKKNLNRNIDLPSGVTAGRRDEDHSVLAEDEDKDTLNLVYTIPVDHNGTSIYLKGWMHSESKFPPVVIVHDLGESVRSYRSTAEAMGHRGFSVFVFDLRGHGRSGRHLGHVPNFETLVEDLLQVVAWVRFKNDGQLPIILAQGVGALIAIYFKKKYAKYTRETILVAPVVSEGTSLSPIYRTFIKSMAEVTPRMRLPRSIVPQFLSMGGTEPTSNQQKFQGITLHFAKEVLYAIGGVSNAIKSLTGPVMLIVPKGVEAYDQQVLETMLENLSFKDDLKLVELENIGTQALARTEEHEIVLDSVYNWLESVLETPNER